ncbi:secreted protein, partial [Melampsora americana]
MRLAVAFLLMTALVWAWPLSILSIRSPDIVGLEIISLGVDLHISTTGTNVTTKCWGGCQSQTNTFTGGLIQDFPTVCREIQSFSTICANTVTKWPEIPIEVHRMATSCFDLFQQFGTGCGTCQQSMAFQFQSAVQGFFIVMQSIISILVEQYNSHLYQCSAEFELISAAIHAITGIAHSLNIDLGSVLMSIGIDLLIFDLVNIDLRTILDLDLSGLFG